MSYFRAGRRFQTEEIADEARKGEVLASIAQDAFQKIWQGGKNEELERLLTNAKRPILFLELRIGNVLPNDEGMMRRLFEKKVFEATGYRPCWRELSADWNGGTAIPGRYLSADHQRMWEGFRLGYELA